MLGYLGHQLASLRRSRGYRRLDVRQASSSHVPEEGEQRVPEVDVVQQQQQQQRGGSKKTAAAERVEIKGVAGGRGSTNKSAGHSGKKEAPQGRRIVHPVQRVLDARRIDKAMAKPEFVRYLAYVREAGRWDGESDRPVIFFD